MAEKPSSEEKERVRLISREEADEAIKSGVVVSKQRESSFPTIVDDDDESKIDLRSVDRVEGEMPEDSGPQMPHWTEPATGQVPIVLGADDIPEIIGPRWRDTHSSWKENDEPTLHDLHGTSGLGAADVPRAQDEMLEDEGGEPAPPADREPAPPADRELAPPADRFFKASSAATDAAVAEPAGDIAETPQEKAASKFFDYRGDVHAIDSVSFTKRVITGAAFSGAALVAFLVGPAWVLTLAAAILLFAAAEYFDAVRRVGYRPATVLGLLAVAGLLAGGYARGEAALPLVLGMAMMFTFLWYLTGVIKESPTANVAVTLLGVLWIGVLGSYAALLLRMPHRHGMAYLLGAILVTATYDTGAYLGGSLFGKHKLIPSISPNKSWEGLALGTIAAVVVGGLGISIISPWSFVDGIALGLVVSLVAPLGDLAESMVKRDLGLKDMGRILPGHGGVLDRFDAMLFVFPATYYLVLLLHV